MNEAMKKLIFIIFSLLLYLSGFAQQQYKPVLDGEIIRWSFLDTPECASSFGVKSRDIIAYGDVLINDVMYKKLYFDYFNSGEAEESNTNWKNHTPLLYHEWENFFIRESEDASMLYIYNSYRDKEYLISDMNLQERETFHFFENYLDGSPQKAIVDTVYFENDLKHIRIPYGSTYYEYGIAVRRDSLTLIESVGPNKWFIYPLVCGGNYGLNCFQNNRTFYKNDKYMSPLYFAVWPCGCYYSYYDGTNSITENNYHIFIQKDKIEILFDSDTNTDISIYDMYGKSCHVENDIFDKKFIILTDSFPKGVYVLKIFDKRTNQMNTNKVIIQ